MKLFFFLRSSLTLVAGFLESVPYLPPCKLINTRLESEYARLSTSGLMDPTRSGRVGLRFGEGDCLDARWTGALCLATIPKRRGSTAEQRCWLNQREILAQSEDVSLSWRCVLFSGGNKSGWNILFQVFEWNRVVDTLFCCFSSCSKLFLQQATLDERKHK